MADVDLDIPSMSTVYVKLESGDVSDDIAQASYLQVTVVVKPASGVRTTLVSGQHNKQYSNVYGGGSVHDVRQPQEHVHTDPPRNSVGIPNSDGFGNSDGLRKSDGAHNSDGLRSSDGVSANAVRWYVRANSAPDHITPSEILAPPTTITSSSSGGGGGGGGGYAVPVYDYASVGTGCISIAPYAVASPYYIALTCTATAPLTCHAHVTFDRIRTVQLQGDVDTLVTIPPGGRVFVTFEPRDQGLAFLKIGLFPPPLP